VLSLLLALTLAGSPPGPVSGPAPVVVPPADAAPDTVLAVRRGDRLASSSLAGSVEIRGWDRDEVLVESAPPGEGGVSASRRGGEVVLGGRDTKGRRLERSVRLRVPRWMEVELEGRRLSVDAAGLSSAVSVRTVDGDVRVRDVEGAVAVRSVAGTVQVEDVRGTVSAGTLEEAVVVRRVTGSVRVESTDGDLFLEEVDGERVEAVTVDGDVTFLGVLRAGGTYRFSTHDGDVLVTVPRDAGAEVSVSTFDGSFQADFPVTVERFQGGRETSFRLGSGGARLVIQAFDGDIHLRQRR